MNIEVLMPLPVILYSPEDLVGLSHPKRPVAVGSDTDVVDYSNKVRSTLYLSLEETCLTPNFGKITTFS